MVKDSRGIFHLSCIEDCLAEEPLDELCHMKSIKYDEFQKIWNNCLAEYNKNWENVKKKYKVGSYVRLRVEYYYPQGIILKGRDFNALYIGNRKLGLHDKVTLKVVQYNDENHWIVVM